MTRFPLTIGPSIVKSKLPLIFDKIDEEVLDTTGFFKYLENKKDIHRKIYRAYLAKYATLVLKKRCDMIIVNNLVISLLSDYCEQAIEKRLSEHKEVNLDIIKEHLSLIGRSAGVSKGIYEEFVALDKRKHAEKVSREVKELIKKFSAGNVKDKIEVMDKMRFARSKEMIKLAMETFENKDPTMRDKALELLCYLSIDFELTEEQKKKIYSIIQDKNLKQLVQKTLEFDEIKMLEKQAKYKTNEGNTREATIRYSRNPTFLEIKIGNDTYTQKDFQDFFEALRSIRRKLDKKGIILQIYGSSKRVWPSALARNMGQGLKAQILTSHEVLSGELVGIFNEAVNEECVSVEEQEEYHNNLVEKFKQNIKREELKK